MEEDRQSEKKPIDLRKESDFRGLPCNPFKEGSCFLQFNNLLDKSLVYREISHLPEEYYSCTTAVEEFPSSELFKPLLVEGTIGRFRTYEALGVYGLLDDIQEAYVKRKEYLKNPKGVYQGDKLYGQAVLIYLDGGYGPLQSPSYANKLLSVLQDGASVGIYLLIFATVRESSRLSQDLKKACRLEARLTKHGPGAVAEA